MPDATLLTSLELEPGFEDEWRRLAEAQSNAFVTPEWYRAWIAAYPDGVEPAIAAVRDPAGALLGVLTLAASGAGRRRRWGFGGANLGDLFAPACPPGEELAVARVAAGSLESGGAGLLVLDNVEAGAPWVGALCERLDGPPLARLAYRTNALPWIELEGVDWDSYLSSRSRNLRSQVNRKTRALERDHRVEYRLADETSVGRDLETFFDLHEARWAGRGGSGSLTASSRAFHRTFAASAAARGWLRLWTLEVDGQPAASWYGWRIGDSYCYYLAGFEPRFGELSVGFVLLARTIRAAVEEGCQSYELLLGEESYKARFATGERAVETVVLVARRHPLRLVLGAEVGFWRLGRRLPPGARDRARKAYRTLSSWLPTSRGR